MLVTGVLQPLREVFASGVLCSESDNLRDFSRTVMHLHVTFRESVRRSRPGEFQEAVTNGTTRRGPRNEIFCGEGVTKQFSC